MAEPCSEQLTFSPGSEDLALGLEWPEDLKQSPSVNRTNSVNKSLESTGLMYQSTTISEPCLQMDLETLTSYVEDSPANPGQTPERNSAQKMTVTSGRKWLPLLKNYDLSG